MEHSTALWVKFEICILAKFNSDVLYSTFKILPQISKLISSSQLTSHEKSWENEKAELSCTNSWSLSKVLPKFMESSCRSQKKTELGVHLHTFFFSGVQFADVMLDMLHIFWLISVQPWLKLSQKFNRSCWDYLKKQFNLPYCWDI